jgi:flavodoxin
MSYKCIINFNKRREKKVNINNFQLCKTGRLILSLVLLICLFVPSYSSAKQDNKTLVIYYSNTGNTKAACTALQKKIGTDIIEIKDLKNNPGKLTMKTDKKLNLVMETDIDPQTVNISKYSSFILGSPIWMGTLSPAIRKFLSLNKFEGKKVAIFTTTNAHENEKMQEKNKNFVKQSDGEVIGYYQVLAMEEKDGKKVERSIEQIVEDALKFAPEIQKVFSASP